MVRRDALDGVLEPAGPRGAARAYTGRRVSTQGTGTTGSRVANGLIKGRPGVIGLGVLWHYGVAYAYRRETYYINNTVFMKKRFFKVNEGWSDFSPSYYSAYDVFLGLTARMSNP